MSNLEPEETLLQVAKDLRNWIRVAAYPSVKRLLEEALPDAKARRAYQMFDGNASRDQIRVECKMSPNAVTALAAKCSALGLMDTNAENKRVRLFDLTHFGLLPPEEFNESEVKSGGKKGEK